MIPVLVLLVTLSSFLYGQDISQQPSLTGSELAYSKINEFRDAVYNDENDNVLADKYETLRITLNGIDMPPREKLYAEALSVYYMARGVQASNSIEDSIQFTVYSRKGQFKKMQGIYTRLDEIVVLYEEALELADAYLEGGRDGRGVWLYTAVFSQLTTLKTLGFLLAQAPKIPPLVRELEKLDPGSPGLVLLQASRYVYSPKMFGSNPDRGISMLEGLYNSDKLNREDRYNVDVAIGYCHLTAGRLYEAIQFFQQALDVYPNNIFARGMIQVAQSGGLEY